MHSLEDTRAWVVEPSNHEDEPGGVESTAVWDYATACDDAFGGEDSQPNHQPADRESERDDHPYALVVEDNGITAGAIQRFLETRGWKVTHVCTVAAAMTALATMPDWIILDLMLPDGDGLRVLREIRFRDLPIAVAISTATSDPDYLQEAHDLDPDVFLHKPFTSSDMGRAMGIR